MQQKPLAILWCLHIDGAASKQGCKAILILITLEPECIDKKYALHMSFTITNNETNYETLLAGLRLAQFLKMQRLHTYDHLQLIVRQVTLMY